MNLFSSLKSRLVFAFAGMLLGVVLGILVFVRWLEVDVAIAAISLVVIQVTLARFLPDWRERLVADSAVIGMILAYALKVCTFWTVLGVLIFAPLCSVYLALIAKAPRKSAPPPEIPAP